MVVGDGAEGTGAETAAVAGKGELDLLECRDASFILIIGVGVQGEGQFIKTVELCFIKGKGGRILDDQPVHACLDDALAPDGVLLHQLDLESLGIRQLAALGRSIGLLVPVADFLEGRYFDGVEQELLELGSGCSINSPLDIDHVLD
ncbi:hypothetical protein DSECCO2_456410 [anaerobic digester metagenome]